MTQQATQDGPTQGRYSDPTMLGSSMGRGLMKYFLGRPDRGRSESEK